VNRWWIYQKERFPLAAHGPLVAAFSFCAVAYSANLRRPGAWPEPRSFAVAFACALLFFLQLRIADEHKDIEEDTRWRPYRPVPRGLVSLRELAWVFAAGALLQLGLALWLRPALVGWLGLTWAYLAAMSKEFGVRDWLKARPVTYLWSHMLIMPLIDFFGTSCDWTLHQAAPPAGLGWFLAASFCNGVVIELGRKIRAPEQEEEGVETYTALWGPRRAILAWLAMVAATAAFGALAGLSTRAAGPIALVLGVALCLRTLMALRFLRRPEPARAQAIQWTSALWTLTLYLSLGLLPHLPGLP
jgi:4-hydroxybenzoate polyprenyltransferase